MNLGDFRKATAHLPDDIPLSVCHRDRGAVDSRVACRVEAATERGLFSDEAVRVIRVLDSTPTYVRGEPDMLCLQPGGGEWATKPQTQAPEPAPAPAPQPKATEPAGHPLQPVYRDERGTLRFRANEIVRFLLDTGVTDMNKLACMPFSREDREQFAQLIGYSVGGFSELSYASDEAVEAAELAAEMGKSMDEARLDVLRGTLQGVELLTKQLVTELFGIDLDEEYRL